MSVLPYPLLSVPLNQGLYGVESGFRNGVVPPGPRLRSVAHMSNTLLAHRQKVLFRKGIAPGPSGTYPDAFNAIASATTYRTRFHTSPGASDWMCRYILIPVDNSAINADVPRARWTITPDGGGAVNQAYIYANSRVAAGSSIHQGQWWEINQPFTGMAADTSYEAYLTQEDQLRIIACTIHEIPRVALDTSSDTYAVDATKFGANSPIYDRDALDLFSAQTRMYKRQGTNFFNYTVGSTTARTTTSTADVNILSLATGAWSTDTPGWVCDPIGHGAIETYNSGTNRETVPVHCWAYVSITGGATATITFRDQNATIATLTTTSASVVLLSSSTTWVAPSNATMKVEVEMKTSSGAQTCSVWAAGMYHFE